MYISDHIETLGVIKRADPGSGTVYAATDGIAETRLGVARLFLREAHRLVLIILFRDIR